MSKNNIPHNVCHFAIHAEDLPRAQRFYEKAFGWKFRAWGPPDFLLIRTGSDDDPGIHGSLQKRHESLASGGVGYECTIAVVDVDGITETNQRNSGEIVLRKAEIPMVGCLIQFLDTEGNKVWAMQYD